MRRRQNITRISIASLLLALTLMLNACSSEQNAEIVTLYKAKEVITLSEQSGNTIAVQGDKIVAVGQWDELSKRFTDKQVETNLDFASKVFVPGFINQHDHPWLAALTLDSHIISIEDWDLPTGFFPKASSKNQYRALLTDYVNTHGKPDKLFLSWGYHQLWHGDISRSALDEISTEVPIVIYHRSIHEVILNSKAIELIGLTTEVIKTFNTHERSQTNLAKGHFWEVGFIAMAPKLFPELIKPEKFMNALYMIQYYWQQGGSTWAIEPGGMLNKQLYTLQNLVFGPDDVPFHMDYIVDGKTLAKKSMDELIALTEETRTWGEGMSRFLPKQVKLFADGAVFSQLMQMSEGYLDGHKGEWMMEPLIFRKAFAKYWDAGYQIHIHQNGDAGLDLILDTLEENLQRSPREDHRTVIVHFSNSRSDQIERIKDLGAIVSVNPYYPVSLANKYSEVGIGPKRAHQMARLGELEKAGISFSLHSDTPVAPGRPLYLMWCAVNRKTLKGNVVAPEQRITPLKALEAVTKEAAFSVGLEKLAGTIESGKLANITVLGTNPLRVNPLEIKDIPVLATIHEGRLFVTADQEMKKVSFSQTISAYWQIALQLISGR